MKESKPTTKPQLRGKEFTFVPVNTETKTTQTQTFKKFEAVKAFMIELPYNSKRVYEIGDLVPIGREEEKGYPMVDGYNCHMIDAVTVEGIRTITNFIPKELIKERLFSIVREYKTTTWEILKK